METRPPFHPLVLPPRRARRFPKDLAATLLTVACAEGVLDADRASPHAWEAERYGATPRGYGSGSKTRGTMARSRSGQHVVSFPRLDEWQQDRPGVTTTARSGVWSLLRKAALPGGSATLLLSTLETTSYWIAHRRFPHGRQPAIRMSAQDDVLKQLAACGSFDGIAALWALLLEALAHEYLAVALNCARYLPPSLALLACTVPGRRVAHVMFARMRQLTLDHVRHDGFMLALAQYDLPTVAATAAGLGHATIVQRQMFTPGLGPRVCIDLPGPSGLAVEMPLATLAWIGANRADIAPCDQPHRRRIWLPKLSPFTHPEGPCHRDAEPHYHADALARFRAALGRSA
jgi:hypothetical protein